MQDREFTVLDSYYSQYLMWHCSRLVPRPSHLKQRLLLAILLLVLQATNAGVRRPGYEASIVA